MNTSVGPFLLIVVSLFSIIKLFLSLRLCKFVNNLVFRDFLHVSVDKKKEIEKKLVGQHLPGTLIK